MAKKVSVPHFNKELYHCIADLPGISRSAIAEQLGISLSKTSYEINRLLKYGLVLQIPGGDTGSGRPASGFRAYCPIIFRVFDLSAHSFTVSDYSAEGVLLRGSSYLYREDLPIEINLEQYLQNCCTGYSAKTVLFSSLLVSSPERFADPTITSLRGAMPSSDELIRFIEKRTPCRILCRADTVSAVTQSAIRLAAGKLPHMSIFLGEEMFTVFLSANGEACARSLVPYLTEDTMPDLNRIAHSCADALYLSGSVSWHFCSARKYCAAEDLIRAHYPDSAEFPTKITRRLPLTHYCLFRRMRSYWFDQVCGEITEKLSAKAESRTDMDSPGFPKRR